MKGEYDLVVLGKSRRSDLYNVFNVKSNNTALIVMDVQYFSSCRTTGMGKLFQETGHEDMLAWRFDRIEQKVLPNLIKLQNACRKAGIKIVYVTVGSEEEDYSDLPVHIKMNLQTYNGRVGMIEANVLEEIKPMENEVIFNKTTVGAFSSTSLDIYLRRRHIETLFFCGVSTSCCVDTTARTAADLGYHCAILEDACSDMRKEDHEYALFNFQRYFGLVLNTEEAITIINKGKKAELVC